jgi:hypothetical protein
MCKSVDSQGWQPESPLHHSPVGETFAFGVSFIVMTYSPYMLPLTPK